MKPEVLALIKAIVFMFGTYDTDPVYTGDHCICNHEKDLLSYLNAISMEDRKIFNEAMEADDNKSYRLMIDNECSQITYGHTDVRKLIWELLRVFA